MKCKNKTLDQLTQPLRIKLAVDGTVMNTKKNYVVYSLCAFECNETNFSSPKSLVVLGVIAIEENYQMIRHYFRDLHKDLQSVVDKKSVKVENFDINYEFIICSDMKALLNLMGLNSVSGKYHCIYCKTSKEKFYEIKTFFDNISEKNDIKRKLSDWSENSKVKNGIINDMMIKTDIHNFIVDTLHLRIRIVEKVFSAVFSSIVNSNKIQFFATINQFNNALINNQMPGEIYKEDLSDNYVKYKIKAPNLNQKLKALEFIMTYITVNYSNFNATKSLFILWEV
jgi:hypothetical protein